MSDLGQLPPGVHPGDPSVPIADVLWGDHPVGHDQAQSFYERGARPWGGPNSRALQVFQRLASDFVARVYTVTTQTAESSVIRLTSRRPGRTRISLFVPSSYFPGGVLTTTPAGVMVAENQGVLQSGDGAPLFVGDSMDIASEGGIWVGTQPGQTTGVVAFVDCWDQQD